MAKVKKSTSVIAAEELLDAKQKELANAEALVKKLRQEVGDAYRAVRDAQIAEDEKLPQCDMVSVEWRSRKESSCGRVVVLRKTPTGILVVRRVGGGEFEFKFKYSDGRYVTTEKRSYAYSATELRNVPDEFLP